MARVLVDAPLVVQVSLVADEHDDDIVATLGSHVVDPLARVHERSAVWSTAKPASATFISSCFFLRRNFRSKGQRTGDVVDDDGDARVADVRRDQTAEAFLAGRVPQLESDGAVLEVHGLGQEVDACPWAYRSHKPQQSTLVNTCGSDMTRRT